MISLESSKGRVLEEVLTYLIRNAEFNRMLSLLADRNTEGSEIITTLFAVCNDFLIDGKSLTDDEIIRERNSSRHRRWPNGSNGCVATILFSRDTNAGGISHEIAKELAEQQYESFRII